MTYLFKAVRPLLTVGLLCSAISPALAAGPDNPASVLSVLGTAQVPSDQLAKLRGGTLVAPSINIGIDSGNSANNSTTGSISNSQSVNNNTGLTTILQNTGNNALLQSSMSVNITVH